MDSLYFCVGALRGYKCKALFTSCLINQWHSLLQDAMEAKSLVGFKKGLDIHMNNNNNLNIRVATGLHRIPNPNASGNKLTTKCLGLGNIFPHDWVIANYSVYGESYVSTEVSGMVYWIPVRGYQNRWIISPFSDSNFDLPASKVLHSKIGLKQC